MFLFLLYYTPPPPHLCRGVYSFRLSVRPFVCSYVRSFFRLCVRSFVLPSCLWNDFKVLRASNLSGVYLTSRSSESIHIWTIDTLEGRLSFHNSSPQGPCPGVGLEINTFKKCFLLFGRSRPNNTVISQMWQLPLHFQAAPNIFTII